MSFFRVVMIFLLLFKIANANLYLDVSNSGHKYGISPKILWAIMKVESGYKRTIHKNADGSFDIGLMQINSLWINSLAKKGFKANLLDDKNNINIAGFILKEYINKGYSLWQAVGLYHSSDKKLRAEYIKRVKRAIDEQRYYLD